VSVCMVLVCVAEGIDVFGRAVDDEVEIVLLFCRGECFTQQVGCLWRGCDVHLFAIGPENLSQPSAGVMEMVMVMVARGGRCCPC
jgi:hypothetical protein